MRKFTPLITLVILTLLISGCTFRKSSEVVLKSDNVEKVDTSLSSVIESGVIRVGISSGHVPYVIKTDEGKYKGFMIDFMNKIAEQVGVTAEYVEIGDNSVVNMISDDKIDIVLNGYSQADLSNSNIYWLTPYMTNHHVIVCKKASGIESKDDLIDKDIGVTKDTISYMSAQSDFKIDNDSLVEFQTEFEGLNALAYEKIDALIIEDTYFYNDDSLYKNNYKILDEIISTHVHSIGLSKESLALKDELEGATAKLSSSDVLTSVSKKWFSMDLTN